MWHEAKRVGLTGAQLFRVPRKQESLGPARVARNLRTETMVGVVRNLKKTDSYPPFLKLLNP